MGEVKMRKRIALLAMQAFLLFTLLAGTTDAWFIDETAPENAAEAKAAKINASLDFSLNSKKGIPGEKVVISDKNTIMDNGSSRNYIYKITYTLSEGSELIEHISLSEENTDNLAVQYDSTAKTLTVYGVNKVETRQDKNIILPVLAAEFKVLRNPSQAAGFMISANLQYCQNTKAAAEAVLGINDALFLELNNGLGGGSNE